MSEEWLTAASRPVRDAKVDSSAPNVARMPARIASGRAADEVDIAPRFASSASRAAGTDLKRRMTPVAIMSLRES